MTSILGQFEIYDLRFQRYLFSEYKIDLEKK